jgi:nickel-dependent lactate racemase
MIYFQRGHARDALNVEDLRQGLFEALEKIGPRKKVLAVPPDMTRFYSRSGEITRLAWEYYGDRLADVLPALGTHTPMSKAQIGKMYAGVPPERFRVHEWRSGLATLGEVPAELIREVSEGRLDYSWPAQLDRLVAEGGHDLVLSIGQVVPHEVAGMASYNKNLWIGTGGREGINRSHYLGAVYGMERMMGRADNPVRRVLNHADRFARHLPIVYALTVVGVDERGRSVCRGLFVGDDIECFYRASELSMKVNFTMLEEAPRKVVAFLDPEEFKSTWLGNKAVYRTRMAIADGGELVVLAPGLKEFGEDREIDRLIRKYGYVGTPRILELVRQNADLRDNLSAAAHLIHGSSEGRFTITYCPGHLSREEVEGVGFRYADLAAAAKLYNPETTRDGINLLPNGEEFYYISNPAMGLWAHRDRFK